MCFVYTSYMVLMVFGFKDNLSFLNIQVIRLLFYVSIIAATVISSVHFE